MLALDTKYEEDLEKFNKEFSFVYGNPLGGMNRSFFRLPTILGFYNKSYIKNPALVLKNLATKVSKGLSEI